jgi:hypothetical protein
MTGIVNTGTWHCSLVILLRGARTAQDPRHLADGHEP